LAAEQPTAATRAHARGEQPTLLQSAAPAAGGADGTPAPSLRAHPRFAAKLRRAREAAGLAGFLVALWLAHSTHSLDGAIVRAIAAGLLAQIVVWAAGVLLGRQLVGVELRAREEAALQRARALALKPGPDR
jgi:hypothetical protein